MKLRRLLLGLALLVLGISANAQYFQTTPDDYNAAVFQAQQYVDFQLNVLKFDVTHPAEARIYQEASIEMQNSGNWGYYYHQADKVENLIPAEAEELTYVFVFDDCAGYTNDNIPWDRTYAKNFTPDEVVDIGRHSHHVGGCVAGYDESIPIGIAGELVPLGKVVIVPIKVLNNQGSGFYSWIIEGTDYAIPVARQLIAQGHNVLFNYSLGGSGFSAALDKSLQQAKQAGILIFAASGNTGRSPIQNPGNSQYTEAVNALSQSGSGVTIATYSSRGPEAVFAGAGTRIYGLAPNNGRVSLSGTSMASPIVAGCAAVLMSCKKEGPEETFARLVNTAADLGEPGRDELYGFGAPQLLEAFGGDGGPAPPDGPPPGPPTKNKRWLEFWTEPISLIWGPAGQPATEVVNCRFRVRLKTEYFANYAIDDFIAATNQFGTNRGLGLFDDSDFVDAGNWTRHFYLMLVSREGYNFKVMETVAWDVNNEAIVIDTQSQFRMRLKTAFTKASARPGTFAIP